MGCFYQLKWIFIGSKYPKVFYFTVGNKTLVTAIASVCKIELVYNPLQSFISKGSKSRPFKKLDFSTKLVAIYSGYSVIEGIQNSSLVKH